MNVSRHRALLPTFQALISSAAQVIRVPPIVFFIVATWARLSHMVFTVSPTIGDLHQLGDGLRLYVPELFDIGLPPDAIAEGVDRLLMGTSSAAFRSLLKRPM
jgi:hypothetical protein